MAAFMLRAQDSPEWYPKEKDRIFLWKLRENETHPGFATTIVTADDGRIVSLCTVTPKRLWYRQTERQWAEIGDTFTDAAFQRRGLFQIVTDASRARAQSAGFSIVYGLPNEKTLPPYTLKLNFGVKDDVEQQEYIIALSTRVLSDRLRARGYPRFGRLVGSSVLSALSRLILTVMARPAASADLVVREERIFDAEFDELWTRSRRDLPFAQIRDARYLKWRFRANPFSFRLLAARRNGRLEGYAVILAAPSDSDSSSKRMYLMDWLFSASESDSVGRALLRAVLRTCLDEGIDILTAHSARRSPLQLPWSTLLTFRRRVAKPVIIHRSESGNQLLADDVPWHLTLSDTDAF